MAWRHQLVVRFNRAAKVQLVRRDGRPVLRRRPERLVQSPVFVLSSVRSGSTLLRMILDSHSEIYAPHELHLSMLKIELTTPVVQQSMSALGFDQVDLTHLLWDRVLDAALQRSGKSVLVEKTPNLVLRWRSVARCWPEARYIFLLRHPAAIVDSWTRARTRQTQEEAITSVTRYLTALREAREVLPGHTVRYEDLTANPAEEAERLCNYLGVEYEPEMLEYGSRDHGPLLAGLGDWKDKIRTGRVQPPRQLPPIDLPAELRALGRELGY